MRVRLAIVTLSAAATLAGAAWADEPAAPPAWYEQFTHSSERSSARAGLDGGAFAGALDFVPSARWGVALRMRNDETAPVIGARAPEEQTSVRAFYQFTPRLRVGGEVTVDGPIEEAAERAGLARAPAAARTPGEDEAKARIRLESAFRF